MEYCPYGSLASRLEKGIRFTEPELREITSHCLLGLDYLHSKNTIHRVVLS